MPSIAAVTLSLRLVASSLGEPSAPPTAAEATPEQEPAPKWRFRQANKPVKVVVLAGSVGAFQGQSYAKWMDKRCEQAEIRNLSRTGFGAYQLRKVFKNQVVENPRVNLRDDRYSYWLVFQGGLNSIADAHRTNHHIRALFVAAHAKGMQVVGLSPTPWGSESDRRRWAGLAGLEYRRQTRLVVDYLTGRVSPTAALGSYAQRRRGVEPAAGWQPKELADVGVDLYDSKLRDRGADLRSVDDMRSLVDRDRRWNRRHRDLSDEERAAARERDAQAAAELPRWYMRSELRGFDHIHPNADGHREMFSVMCPQLPPSWGCRCE
ncbi:MAG: hypothetical protein B7733_14920 [Myxococcales bacterium FL481]|nr:MAG: hypothetical protein B7733_14920 [Myxococcales bacterium FL481]